MQRTVHRRAWAKISESARIDGSGDEIRTKCDGRTTPRSARIHSSGLHPVPEVREVLVHMSLRVMRGAGISRKRDSRSKICACGFVWELADAVPVPCHFMHERSGNAHGLGKVRVRVGQTMHDVDGLLRKAPSFGVGIITFRGRI